MKESDKKLLEEMENKKKNARKSVCISIVLAVVLSILLLLVFVLSVQGHPTVTKDVYKVEDELIKDTNLDESFGDFISEIYDSNKEGIKAPLTGEFTKE